MAGGGWRGFLRPARGDNRFKARAENRESFRIHSKISFLSSLPTANDNHSKGLTGLRIEIVSLVLKSPTRLRNRISLILLPK